MPDPQDSERDTLTRIMVALAVNDTEPPPTRPEIDQIADELIDWGHRLRYELHRAAIADRVAKLSRTELEERLAAQLAPTACCTRLPLAANDYEVSTLTDDDLREQLVEAEAFVEGIAA
ncbi:MAG: hypothetical protein SFX73_17760 [Kofleriaceae bacterium]|nr:hypothetical protein [Kofleriaceae bacterium]